MHNTIITHCHCHSYIILYNIVCMILSAIYKTIVLIYFESVLY